MRKKKTKAQKESGAREKEAKDALLKKTGKKCQRCGIKAGAVKKNGKKAVLQWAHIAGRAKEIKYEPVNHLLLCAGCHLWFDNSANRLEAYEWLLTMRTPKQLKDLMLLKDGSQVCLHCGGNANKGA
ncbi:MAG: hypothetical protein KGJ89_05415 [Patescibacteria group bacterium]|nr:hypothetical protein [Patescibacteria group bacterium]